MNARLGALDATVGKLLGDPELEKRGAALVERSDALGRAAHLDATATQKREQADDELKAKRDEALQDLKEARTATAQEVEHARSTAEDRKARRGRIRRTAERRGEEAGRRSGCARVIRPKRPSATKRPRSERLSSKPPRRQRPSVKMLRQNSATPPTSARRPTGSSNWPTPRSGNAKRSARTPPGRDRTLRSRVLQSPRSA